MAVEGRIHQNFVSKIENWLLSLTFIPWSNADPNHTLGPSQVFHSCKVPWDAREIYEFVSIRRVVLSQSQLFCQNFPKLSSGISEEQMLWVAIIVIFSAKQNLQLLQVNSQDEKAPRSARLGTRICWKSPNLSQFDIKRSKNFNIKLELYLCPGALQ